MSKIVLFFGVLLLGHGAYSVIEEIHQERLFQRGLEKTAISLDIVVEIIIGALLCCIGSAKVSGRFQNISATTNYAKRKYETVFWHSNFCTFNHRGNPKACTD